MKRIGIFVGLVVILALGVVILPRIQQSVAAAPAASAPGSATAPAASKSPDPAQPFQTHSLRGMTSDQLKEYAQAYAAYSHMGQVRAPSPKM